MFRLLTIFVLMNFTSQKATLSAELKCLVNSCNLEINSSDNNPD